jgi:hypothetical protein
MPNRIYSFEEIIKLSEISLDRLIANYQEIYGYAPFWEDPVGNLLLKLKRIEQVGVTFGQKQDIKNVLAECDSAKLRSQNSIDLAGKQLARIDISNQDDMFYVRNLELHKKISEWMPKAENGFFLIDNIKKYCQERINQIEAETEIHHAERLSFSPRGLESKQKQKQDNSILKSIENIELTFNDLRMVEEERLKHPPGTRLMPEEERLETLKDLNESRKEINNALERLPVVIKTMMMQKH